MVLPDDSTTNMRGTDELSYWLPTEGSILSISFLLGFGDALFQNQICSLIGYLYPKEKDAASSFSIFQFVQCIFAAAAFFYSSFLSLSIQLIILTTMLLLGVSSYLLVEINTI